MFGADDVNPPNRVPPVFAGAPNMEGWLVAGAVCPKPPAPNDVLVAPKVVPLAGAVEPKRPVVG